MSSLRPLLRLDDKVAAEGRRLELVASRPARRTVVLIWSLALGLHLVALAVPLVGAGPTVVLRTLRPDLPLVWRWAPPRPPEPTIEADGGPRDVETQGDAAPTVTAPWAFNVEPVAEPVPNLAATVIPADVEELIPAPDSSSAAFEPALAPRSVAAAEPVVRRMVKPKYPAGARSLDASGTVTLEVAVLEDGTVGFARIIACTRPALGFEESALLAVRQWLYDPAPAGVGARTVTAAVAFRHDEERP